jgi:heterodisulfide reductase subunit A
VLSKEIGYIERLGVEIKTNSRIGEEIGLEELRKSYGAIFISTGAHESLKLGVPEENACGVIHGVEFLRDMNMGKKVEVGKQVAVIGGGNVAIDASRVARRLGAVVKIIYRRSRSEMPATPSEVEAAEEEGIELMFLAAPTRIIAENGRVSKLECIRMELGAPDESGRRRPNPVEGSEFVLDVDTVIPAIGQASDVEFVKGLGLEVSPRGTIKIDEATLATNIEGIFAGGDVVTGPAMVVDAIAAGKKAACSIDEYLKGETLTSKEDKRVPQKLGEEEVAQIKERFTSLNRVKASELEPEARVSAFEEVEQVYSIYEAQDEAGRCFASQIEGCIECGECEERCDAEAIDFGQEDEIIEVEVGSIILATGYEQFDPIVVAEYGYKKYDNVLTGLEYERMVNASGPGGGQILLKDGREPKSVGIIHCVGSRDVNYHEYCSRVCCMYALKFSHLLREHIPGVEVYQCYIDMRCVGKSHEEFYNRLLEEGVNFVRGRVGEVTNVAETAEEKGKLVMQVEDMLIGQQRRIPVDMVILCCALEPRSDSDEIARLFRTSKSADGFFLERHPKLDPVATFGDGIYVVGCCQGPKDIPDTVVQASAAAARTLALISKGNVETEAAIAVVDEQLCSGCKTCNSLCPYSAIAFDEEKRVSVITEALCKGCGTCAAACPSGAITARQFTSEEIMSQIEGVLV